MNVVFVLQNGALQLIHLAAMLRCTHHQNVKLLVDATKLTESYKELMEKLVCSTENSECMLHRCDQCPGVDNLKTFLEESFKEYDFDKEIPFNQWQSTDRTTLITQTLPTQEFRITL